MTHATETHKPPKEIKQACWLFALVLVIHIVATVLLLFSQSAPPLHLGEIPPLESFFVSTFSHTAITVFLITVILKQKPWARWVAAAYFITRLHFIFLFFTSVTSSAIVLLLFAIHILIFITALLALFADNSIRWFKQAETSD